MRACKPRCGALKKCSVCGTELGREEPVLVTGLCGGWWSSHLACWGPKSMLQHRAGPLPGTACPHGLPGWCLRTCISNKFPVGVAAVGLESTFWRTTGGGVCVQVQSCPALQLHGLWPTRLLCLWGFPGRNTGVGCQFLLQMIFPTQGSNACLSCVSCIGRQIFYHSATWEAPDVIIT